MAKTIVKCSMPGCQRPASEKIAALWSDGEVSELKTYGYACPSHVEVALANARRRPRSRHLGLSESDGEIGAYPLQPDASHVTVES